MPTHKHARCSWDFNEIYRFISCIACKSTGVAMRICSNTSQDDSTTRVWRICKSHIRAKLWRLCRVLRYGLIESICSAKVALSKSELFIHLQTRRNCCETSDKFHTLILRQSHTVTWLTWPRNAPITNGNQNCSRWHYSRVGKWDTQPEETQNLASNNRKNQAINFWFSRSWQNSGFLEYWSGRRCIIFAIYISLKSIFSS